MSASIWIGLLIVLGALLLIAGVFAIAVHNAPMGYKDSTGFHYGVAPADKKIDGEK